MSERSTPLVPDRAGGVPARPDGRGARAAVRAAAGAASVIAPRRAHAWRQALVALGLAGLYVVTGKLGLQLGLVNPSASAVWAPTGIALAALLLLGQRAWPGIFLGAFLVNVTTAGTLATSLGIATGNTIEALLGAALVERFANGRHAFERPQDTFRFAILAGILCTVTSPTVGVTSLSLAGFAPWEDFGRIWLTWWLGDMGGALVVAPLLVLWINDHRLGWSRAHALEAAALMVTLLAVGLLVFSSFSPAYFVGQSLMFLCMPLLAWAAFRFDPRITAVAIFEITAVAVWGTLTSTSGLAPESVNESLVVLQVFVAVAAVTSLALATVVAERRRIHAAVEATKDELHEAMTELEAFSRSITHDLRSPVGAVLNYSAMLVQDHEGKLEDEALLMVRRIRASARSAAHLLEQLTEYNWVGRKDGESSALDMTALAREVHAELVVGGEDMSGLLFELRPLPPGRGSPELLRCVFRNLLGNAVKFTRGRSPRRIQVDGVAGPEENLYTVTDNGIGFDPALGDRLFEPFQRLSPGREFEGSGLGLAIVARIIRRQHGRVWAVSHGAEGAQFGFSLPHGRRDP